jgi:hypothetical protein
MDINTAREFRITGLKAELAATQEELRRAKERLHKHMDLEVAVFSGAPIEMNKDYFHKLSTETYQFLNTITPAQPSKKQVGAEVVAVLEEAYAKAFPAQPQASEPECCGVGFTLSDDHTHWNCGKCGKEWPMLITPVGDEPEMVCTDTRRQMHYGYCSSGKCSECPLKAALTGKEKP